MEYSATTVEMDNAGFDDLQDQLVNNKYNRSEQSEDIREKSKTENRSTKPEKEERSSTSSKKYAFTKGESVIELDDDYEIQFTADKRPTRMTLRELKDRAAGDIAVKNRMHSLAEEKKRVQSTFKQFSELAKTDPLGALEYISSKATESDSEFEYSKYIEKLAEQAEKLGQMDEKEKKAWELEKKLKKAEQDLSHKERTQAVILRKQEMLADYPEIGDQQFGQMVDAILESDELSEGLESEKDVMDKVEELIQETLTQKDIITVIREINPEYLNDNNLIFSLSDQLKANPDLDEEDVRDIIRAIIAPEKRQSMTAEKQKDVKTLSRKARQGSTVSNIRNQNASPYELLKQQLMEKKRK